MEVHVEPKSEIEKIVMDMTEVLRRREEKEMREI